MDTSLVDKSDGELSDGELPSDEGEVSDEGELPESEEEVEMSTEVPDKSPKGSGDKFDRYKIWQEAMVNNMRSAMTKVTDANHSTSEESGSDEENSAFMMVNKVPTHTPLHITLYLFAKLCCIVIYYYVALPCSVRLC